MRRLMTHRVGASVDIAANADDVWPFLAEFRHWPAWGPTVRAVESSAERVASGVTGRVQTIAGIWLPFEITRCEPPHLWDWRVGGIPATGHCIEALGPGRCRVMFSAPLLAAPYVIVLRRGLRRLAAMTEAS